MKKILLSVSLLTLFVTVLAAADIDGKWKASYQTPNGDTRETTFTFKADGGALTGTVEGGRGGPAQITDGKISGGDVSFAVVRNFNGNERKVTYKGTLSGDELKLNVNMGGDRKIEMTAKRSTT